MNNKTQTCIYLTADFMAAHLAWFVFNVLRYFLVAYKQFDTYHGFVWYSNVVQGQLIIPLGWLVLHYYSGYYNSPLVKSHLSVAFRTFMTCIIGSLSIFFIVLLNNLPESINIYYEQITYLFLFSFGFTYLFRLIITNRATKKIRSREWTTPVLILGTGDNARQVSKMLERSVNTKAYTIQGYIETDTDKQISTKLNTIGHIRDLADIIRQFKTRELIVATESNGDELLTLLYALYQYKLPIKLPLNRFQLLIGHIKVHTIKGAPLIDITESNYPEGEKNIKMTLDKIISALAMLLLSPVYAYLAFRVYRDSKGPIIIRQERIGYMGKPFNILKFRTMYENAESDGPLLSSEKDERITPVGHFMRKYRLDELPQFWNVLCGDMSIVGPRPERRHYIKQIVEKAPYYYLLHNVYPGITSLGMVKFGYARNIEEMIERLQYDILYYENMSLLMDIKILIYSIQIICTGKGI